MADASAPRTAPSVSPVSAWEALFRAQVTVMRTLSDDFPAHGISLTEYDVLYTLSIQPQRRMRIRDLNSRTLLTQPSVSRLVDRLANRSIVSKAVDPADGRGTIVTLTDHGFTLYRDAARIHGRSITGQMTSALSADELAELTALCDKLRIGITGGNDDCVVETPGA
ncbi:MULTISPECIES: MarR family winged helix-turn-helix transcriptional regulator [Subtercola]|uniref:MarR family transcriptional regulator n=1 Tax=Subtercola vilae TaxID=2056433 RepID=A0A4T2C6V0_9MICO|nr:MULTISPECIES: MarR family winged helix-turn-helix transcriptional regulator [Subtercola]MEA9984725.1 MarR family winged helix-turn-helix transcriptional regulator [Subtercola sp. RTI3]TIH39031.1 MarR family transcriptional regulator [Subtercola vilae]